MYGIAFEMGYLSQLLGDVLPHIIQTGEFSLKPILWPFQSAHDHHTVRGSFVEMVRHLLDDYFVDTVRHLLDDYLTMIIAMEPTPNFIMKGIIYVTLIVLWIYDGMPLLRGPASWIRAKIFEIDTESNSLDLK